jgi:hypothetical protein
MRHFRIAFGRRSLHVGRLSEGGTKELRPETNMVKHAGNLRHRYANTVAG